MLALHSSNHSRVLGFRLLLWAMMLASPIIQADQNDGQLDELFVLLQGTSNPELLTEIENRIWDIWYQHPDTEIQDLFNQGVELLNGQFLREAMAVFNTIVERQPTFAEAWNQRATLNYLIGDYSASLADIDKVLELEPRHFGALSGRGLVYLQMENLTQAKAAFEELQQVHPNSPSARDILQTINEALNQRFI